MLEPSRRHGHYDQRWPAWSRHTIVSTPNGARDDEGGRGAISAWEGEGGSAPEPDESRGAANGLSWERFSEVFSAGKSRHDFPGISAWSRYRQGEPS